MFYSVFPTVGTYGGYLQGMAPNIFPNVWIAILIGLAFSIILAVIFYQENIKSYKKSLAEVLATGYFMNFTGRLGKLLKTKVPIQFSFPDNSLRSFDAGDIMVKVGLPSNLQALNNWCEKVESESEIAYVREASYSEPFWVWANVEDGQLIIYEFPRTLFSIPKYLHTDFKDEKNSEKNSKRIFKYFRDKMDQLRIEHAGEISRSNLQFVPV